MSNVFIFIINMSFYVSFLDRLRNESSQNWRRQLYVWLWQLSECSEFGGRSNVTFIRSTIVGHILHVRLVVVPCAFNRNTALGCHPPPAKTHYVPRVEPPQAVGERVQQDDRVRPDSAQHTALHQGMCRIAREAAGLDWTHPVPVATHTRWTRRTQRVLRAYGRTVERLTSPVVKLPSIRLTTFRGIQFYSLIVFDFVNWLYIENIHKWCMYSWCCLP